MHNHRPLCVYSLIRNILLLIIMLTSLYIVINAMPLFLFLVL